MYRFRGPAEVALPHPLAGGGAPDGPPDRTDRDGTPNETPADPSATLRDPPRPAPGRSGTDRDATSLGERESDDDPVPSSERERYFELAYSRALTVDADLLARDFAVSVLDGDYLVLASSTPPEAASGTGAGPGAEAPAAPAPAPNDARERSNTPPETVAETEAVAAARADGAAAVARARAVADAQTAAARGAPLGTATTTLPGSPSMDVVALHLVRLSDGKVCDRRVFRDDYVRLRRGAAVSTLRESADATLLSVLSLRWQAFRLIRVSRTKTRARSGASAPASASAPGPSRDVPRLSDAETDEWEETAVFSDARPPVGAACAPDDEDPLAAQDAVERRWLAEQAAMGSFHEDACGWAGDDEGDGDDDDDGFDDTTEDERALAGRNGDGAGPSAGAARRTARRGPRASPPPPPTSRVTGWSDPKSQMYAGIKQKIMTRILMEARRRDAAAEKAAAAETARVGEKRPRDVPSRSRDVLRPETPSRGVHTRAFFSRYWSYAEWMVLWHVELLDDRRAMLRFGTAEDVLAWGTRRSRSEAAPPGGERAPETVLSAVMDYVDGRVMDYVEAGGNLRESSAALFAGGEEENERLAGGAGAASRRGGARGLESEWPAPRAEGSEWRRLAAGVSGVGGFRAEDGDSGDFRDGDVLAANLAKPSQQNHWCASPYYDARMFLFDGRAAAPDERQRPATEHALRFAAAKRRVARVKARVAREERSKNEGTVGRPANEDRGLRGDGVMRTSGTHAGDDGTSGTRDGDAFLATLGRAPGARFVRAARFKLPPAEAATRGHNHRQKRTITHVFHPVYPFAMSISQAFMQPQVVSFHVRWER